MNTSDINPKALGSYIKELRRRRNWTQAELAQKVGISTGPMNSLENGHHLPSLPVFSKLAIVLECDASALISNALPRYVRDIHQGKDTAMVQDRGSAISTSMLESYAAHHADIVRLDPMKPALPGRSVEAVNEVILAYLGLEDICGVQKRALVPLKMSLPDTVSGLETFARRIRSVFGVGDAVIFDYLELFENSGLRVIFMPISSGIHSLSCYDRKNQNAFFFIHPENNVERQLFVLCYELGRIYLHNGGMGQKDKIGDKDFEHAARYFAAMFLMPEESVISTVNQVGIQQDDWTWDMLMRLKHRFGVSAEAFLYRVDDLHLISPRGKTQLKQQIKQYYAQHGKRCEPDRSRRILSPNGRLGDLLLRATQLREKEAVEIRRALEQNKVEIY